MGTTPREIGARVKALREFRKVPAVELAKRAGITNQPSQAMNRYEAGRRGIGNDLLVRFADLLQAPVEWLLRGGAGGPIPEPVLAAEEPAAKPTVQIDAHVPYDRLLDIAIAEGIATLQEARDACVALQQEAAGLRGIDEDFARKHFKMWKRERALEAGRLALTHELEAKAARDAANKAEDEKPGNLHRLPIKGKKPAPPRRKG